VQYKRILESTADNKHEMASASTIVEYSLCIT
jgi:hypothetical protein